MAQPDWDAWIRRRGWAALALLWALFLFPGVPFLPLVDRDEPRFSQATREMLDRADPLIPTFNGDYRFDKPPLTYWWMGLHYLVLGRHETAARLHSLLAALLTAWVIWRFGARLFGETAGWLAGAGWMTCLQVLIHGRMAVADMPMVLAVTVIHWAAWERLQSSRPAPWDRWFWLLWGAASAGFLAKGPIALLVPLLSLLLFRWVFWRKPLPWGHLRLGVGLALAFVPIATWGLPALAVTEGAFGRVGLGHHVVERGLEAFNDRVTLPFYYLPTSLFSLFPWILLAGWAVAKARRQWDQRQAFLLSWLLAPVLIFSFYATQLPHYTLPGLAAFFLLLTQPGATPRGSRLEAAWFWTLSTLWLAAGGTLLLFPWFLPLPAAQAALKVILAAAGAWILGLWLLPAGVRGNSYPLLAAGALLAAAGMGVGMSTVRSLHPSVALGRLLTENPPSPESPADRLLGWRYAEPSLVFYSSRFWRFDWDQARLPGPSELAGVPVALFLETEYQMDDCLRAWLQRKPLPLTEDNRALLAAADRTGWRVETLEGVNPGRSSWVRLQVWHRQPLP